MRVIDNKQVEISATLDPMEVPVRKVEFDYLRAFAVVLVLFHHSLLSYTLFASINLENPIATGSPVVNEQRWPIFDLIVAYNETFLMPLLFFVSGIFVWQSLARKGVLKYIGGRLKRLGLPFVIGVFTMIPLAYYPAKLQVGAITGVNSTYGAFWLDMLLSGFGTAGPLWFLWLLLAFDCLAALLYRLAPSSRLLIEKSSTFILTSPVAFFGALLGISIAAYLPLAIIFGPLKWIGIGPFHAQASRILLYLVYFLAGAVIGAYGIERSMFGREGTFTRRWWVFLAVGLIFFIVFIAMILVDTDWDRSIVKEIAFVLCCGATVSGITGFFQRFARRRAGIFDSLSKNSYGIYIVHYIFVVWLQYLLLRNPLAPGVKGIAVFSGTLILSWGTVAALRCIPAVAKII